jgi:hypothetical protein
MIVVNRRGFKGPRTLFPKLRDWRAPGTVVRRRIAAPIDSHQGGSAPKR